MSGKPRAKAPGRPPRMQGDQVPQLLLEAARSLFLAYEFKAVSVRNIATQAGVNPAMVNYYFGSKQGLYLAMVEQMLASLQQSLQSLQGAQGSIAEFVAAYMRFLSQNPWWPNFIVREVLYGKEQFRSQIAQRINQSMASRVVAGIKAEIDAGKFRADLDPELAAWSLMGMMVFPFLSTPLVKTILHKEIDQSNIASFIEHTCQMFLQGASRKGSNS